MSDTKMFKTFEKRIQNMQGNNSETEKQSTSNSRQLQHVQHPQKNVPKTISRTTHTPTSINLAAICKNSFKTCNKYEKPK